MRRRWLCDLGIHRWRSTGISFGAHHERCRRCGRTRRLLWRSLGGRS